MLVYRFISAWLYGGTSIWFTGSTYLCLTRRRALLQARLHRVSQARQKQPISAFWPRRWHAQSVDGHIREPKQRSVVQCGEPVRELVQPPKISFRLSQLCSPPLFPIPTDQPSSHRVTASMIGSVCAVFRWCIELKTKISGQY